MASGIEHRTVESVLQAYTDYDLPNFSIWNGKRLCVKYDGNNIDQGTETLINNLNQIAASGTMSVYTLKVYPENASKTGINNGTLYEGSTTFMLSPTAITTTNQQGITIIDPNSKTAQYGNKEMIARIEKLETANNELRDKLHQEQMERLRTDFTNQIAGLKVNKEPKKNGFDRFMDFIEAKPEMLDRLFDKTFDGLGRVAGIFTAKKNYIQPSGKVAGTVNKTEPKTEKMETENETYELNAEGALINPFLTDAERKLKSGPQSEIIRNKIDGLSQDEHDCIQSECMEIIEKRIGAVNMSLMLLKVASLDNDDLNKLLANLD